MNLADWERNGWLKAHRTSTTEIRDLLAVVERDLGDSTADRLSADWRLTIAYNAALQAATAALAAAGYRASREQHHYRLIQSLEATIGAEPELNRPAGFVPEEEEHRRLRTRRRCVRWRGEGDTAARDSNS